MAGHRSQVSCCAGSQYIRSSVGPCPPRFSFGSPSPARKEQPLTPWGCSSSPRGNVVAWSRLGLPTRHCCGWQGSTSSPNCLVTRPPNTSRMSSRSLHQRRDTGSGVPRIERSSMGRPPLPVGTYANISVRRVAPGRHRARCRFRDYDGQVRYVVRFGPSQSAATRNLKAALVDRVAAAGPADLARTSKVADLSALWLLEIEASELAKSTKARYSTIVSQFIN